MRKIVITLLACGMAAVPAMACTNLIVTRGASSNNSNMATYAADSHQLFGALHYTPAADYPAGTMMEIKDWDTGKILGQIPQASHVYSVIGNMNEHQLVIGETTYGGREFIDTTAILDYGSLIYIALQRCRTARQAIGLIDELMQHYGYASEGESFTICDPEEIWVMEIMGKNPKLDKKGRNVNRGAVWVAKRIPDGYISGHANQSRITTIDFDDPDNCLYSKDVIKHAREQGIFSGKDEDFSFCDVYNPLDFGAARGCEARVWSFFNRFADGMDEYLDYAMGYDLKKHMPLYVKPNRKIGTKDLADMMRDHFEGTPMDMTTDIGAGGSHLPYRWRPMEFEYQGWEYVNERAIATQQTGWWYVAQSRKDQPVGIFWFGVDDAATSPLMPFFSCAAGVPECLREGNGSLLEYSETAMYWIVSRIAQFAYLRYDRIGAEVRSVIDEYENRMISEVARMDFSNAAELDAFSKENAAALFSKWQDLDKYLLVKYIDGNVKVQNPDGSFKDNGFDPSVPEFPIQEPYSEKWMENVVRDNGDVLRIRN
ncbi:MAG: C69 family dipeptidase [Bacteroidaceae bacterium]|nr:C69 family dipeptidase [Bacteroidaceae bacterium]